MKNELCHVNVVLLVEINLMVPYKFILIYYSEKDSGQSLQEQPHYNRFQGNM